MLLDEFGAWIGGQRRPPQLSLETLGVSFVYQRPHIRVAVRKLLRLQEPVPLRGLPSVIQRDPGEAEFFNDGKRAVDLAGLDLAAVSPGAPDRTERALW